MAKSVSSVGGPSSANTGRRRGPHPTTSAGVRTLAVSAWLQQLSDDAEGELAFQVGSLGGEDGELRDLGQLPQVCEQPRLSDPGLTRDDEQPTVSLTHVGDRLDNRHHLAVALEQRRLAHAPSLRTVGAKGIWRLWRIPDEDSPPA